MAPRRSRSKPVPLADFCPVNPPELLRLSRAMLEARGSYHADGSPVPIARPYGDRLELWWAQRVGGGAVVALLLRENPHAIPYPERQFQVVIVRRGRVTQRATFDQARRRYYSEVRPLLLAFRDEHCPADLLHGRRRTVGLGFDEYGLADLDRTVDHWDRSRATYAFMDQVTRLGGRVRWHRSEVA